MSDFPIESIKLEPWQRAFWDNPNTRLLTGAEAEYIRRRANRRYVAAVHMAVDAAAKSAPSQEDETAQENTTEHPVSEGGAE